MMLNLSATLGMKKLNILTCCSALLIVQSAFAADTYVFDKAHSNIGFQIRHLFSNVPGKFDDFTGTIQFDETNPEQSSVEVNIKTASIDTGVKMRDDDLRSPNFFDAAKFPETNFKSKSVKSTGKDTFDVTGDLTMHGVTKQVTLDLEITGMGKNMQNQKPIAGFKVSGTVNRKDFGVGNAPAAMVGNEIQLRAVGEFDQQ